MKQYVIAAVLATGLTTSAQAQHAINSTEDVTDGSAKCLVVQTGNGKFWSYPTPDNPLNAPTQAQFELDGGTLVAASISYHQLEATNPGAVLALYWTIGSPDPYCYGYPQIVNLRLAP